MDLRQEILKLVGEYGVENISTLSIQLAIERFKDLRNYPKTWDDEKIQADMVKNVSKIAMASIEIDSKDAMEGQTQHSENGVTRTFTSGILAYNDVIGYANSI